MDLFLSLVGTGNLFFVCVCVSLLYDTLRLENCIKIRKKKRKDFSLRHCHMSFQVEIQQGAVRQGL